MMKNLTMHSSISIETVGATSETFQPRPQSNRIPLTFNRMIGICFAVGTQIVFLFTAVSLFFFLRDGSANVGNGFSLNAILAVFFAWPHSLLLLPAIQRRMKQHMPSGLIGCVHCLATCISLFAIFAFWTRSTESLWDLHGIPSIFMQTAFYGSWVALLYSLYCTGLGYQTGITPAWYWFRRIPAPRRKFVADGAFRFMRHPVYLSFLGLIWFTPNMTWDHVTLTSIWTIYIFVGSYLKDKRMLLFLGDEYREYASRTPGYPFIGFGPIGRLSLELAKSTANKPR